MGRSLLVNARAHVQFAKTLEGLHTSQYTRLNRGRGNRNGRGQQFCIAKHPHCKNPGIATDVCVSLPVIQWNNVWLFNTN